MTAPASTSTRPYLVRALHEWCTDNGLTPYVAVRVDDSVQVPREYVKDGEIVLNVSYDATSGLQLGNDFIAFKARFGGKPREIVVPWDRVIAIYARENGQGMAFPAPVEMSDPGMRSATDLGQRTSPVPLEEDRAQRVDSDDRSIQLVSPESVPADVTDGAGSNKPQGPGGATPGGARPSLRRIK